MTTLWQFEYGPSTLRGVWCWRAERVASLGLALGLGLAACTSETGEPPEGSNSALKPAKCPEDLPEFVATPSDGLTAAGGSGAVQVRIVDADPPMPERYYNDWTVRLTGPDGNALEDVQIVDTCVSMPGHDHADPARDIVPGDEPGTFELVELNLFMRGFWEIELVVDTGALEGAERVYAKCPRNERDKKAGSEVITLRACVPDD